MNLKELSRILGLSQTTVSRALNGYPDVSSKTRDRVVNAAKLHNYRPNRRARSLATGRTRRVAIVAGKDDRNGLNDPIFCAFLSGAAEVLERQNFEWVIRQPNLTSGAPQIAHIARDESLEGAIITAPSQADRCFAATAKSRFPVVVRGDFSGRESAVSGVSFDYRAAMLSAITALAERGHHHIALITGPREDLLTQAQTAAYYNGMQMSGLPVTPWLVQSGPFTQQFGSSVVDLLLQGRTVPTALVIGCSLISSGVAAGLLRNKSDANSNIDHVFFDDGLCWLNASVNVDTIASLSTPACILGREAASRLLKQIRAPNTVPDVRLLPPSLVLNQGLAEPTRSSDIAAYSDQSLEKAALS